jgi:hypothetical protein
MSGASQKKWKVGFQEQVQHLQRAGVWTPEVVSRYRYIWFHKLIAKCVNALWDRKGSVFCSSSGCRIQVLPRAEDVLDRLAYIVAQPVRHALVENREEWPGFQLTIEQMAGAEIKVRRPAFFSKHMPGELTLTITRPPHFQHLSPEEYTALLRGAVEAKEAKWREHNAREGISYGTRESALAVAHTDRPRRQTIKERHARRPKFATTCPEVRKTLTTYLRCFNRSYTEARLDYAAGNQTRLFPPGTHQLQQLLSIPCHPAQPAGHWPMTRPPPLPPKVE